jgi:hypothetical protein
LLRFVSTPDVARAVEVRIGAMRRLVLDYAAEHHLAEADTGVVDIGWTGRMAGSLIQVCESAGMRRPHILFWGHEPRPATGWTDPKRVAAYVYNTATGQGLGWRVPDAPFVMETFCMGDHGIVSGYHADAAGKTEPVLLSPRNDAAEAWGLRLYRSTLYAFSAALEGDGGLQGDDVRPLVHEVMDAFWCHPSQAEALAWGAYPYDSDPAGTAVRPLARPFVAEIQPTRGDRAWLAGSLTLSTPEARTAYLRHAPEHELVGAPETDLWIRTIYWPIYTSGEESFSVAVPDRPTARAIRSEALLPGSGLELDHQLSGDPAAVLYVNALRLRPLAHLDGVQSAYRSSGTPTGWPPDATSGPTSSPHIARQRVSQRFGMLRAQVNLIFRAVQPEADGTFSVTAVKVIDEHGLYLLGHGCSIPLADLVCQRRQSELHTRTATPMRSAATRLHVLTPCLACRSADCGVPRIDCLLNAGETHHDPLGISGAGFDICLMACSRISTSSISRRCRLCRTRGSGS